MLAIRLREDVLDEVDRECKRAGLTRAAAVNEALALWIARRQYQEAVARDQRGYERQPVAADEFRLVLGAQVWPK